jgi:hypothetical protein
VPRFVVTYYDIVRYAYTVEADSEEEAKARADPRYDEARYEDADSVEFDDCVVAILGE